MKLPSLSLFFCCIVTIQVGAQNLVPNPDFELRDSASCGIFSSTDLDLALAGWYSPTSGSPDAFFTDIDVTCWNYQPTSAYPGPIGLKGEQLPRSGNSMVGIFAYTIASFNQREYLQTELSSALIPTGKYVVECYVSLGDYTEFASNGVGFYLSNSSLTALNDQVLAVTPQYAESAVISETQNWVRVFDTLTVTDAFQYLTIGNFSTDAATSVLANPTSSGEPGTYGAYYFVDDVRVERVFGDPTSSIKELNESNVRILPNPASNEIHIVFRDGYQMVQVELIDGQGNNVWSTNDRFTERTIDISQFEDGIYFIRVQGASGVYLERIVKIQ